MALAFHRSQESASLERRRAQASFLTPAGWLTLLVVTVFTLGAALAPVAYWWGYMAGQREADQEAVYAAVGDALRIGVRLAALSDSVTRVKQHMAVQAAQRLPQRVLDSLRAVRWSTP